MTTARSALHDPDTERAVLAAVLHSGGQALPDLTLDCDDFQHWPYRLLWDAFTRMHRDGAPFDSPSLIAHLGDDLPRALDAITDLFGSGVAPSSAPWHAAQLAAVSTRRRLTEAAARINQAAAGSMDTAELAEFAREQIDTATTARGGAPLPAFQDLIDRAVQRWQSPITDVIPTGWQDLDELLSGGGLRPGHLTVVGARPGLGKSLVATMIAGRTAAAGRGVYFASAEMTADELVDRFAAASTGVSLADLSGQALTGEQVQSMQLILRRLRRWPLAVDDRAHSITAIKRAARTLNRAPAGLSLVVVDYLQLLESVDASRLPRHEVVAGMSRALKLLARDLGVPLVLLSQLNRSSMQRADKRPIISELRESGAVEQDADEIILLHRDDDDPDLAGQVELHLAKNRHGPTGHVRLRWQPYISRITDLNR
jgi:replicative DNA helicase